MTYARTLNTDAIMVLLSGGLDSATVLAYYRDHVRMAIAFDYGQEHRSNSAA